METREILIVQTDNVDFSHLIKELSNIYTVRVRKDTDVCEECVLSATLVITADPTFVHTYSSNNIMLDSGNDYNTVKEVALFFKLCNLSEDMHRLCKYFK